jgi:hypothetical protein
MTRHREAEFEEVQCFDQVWIRVLLYTIAAITIGNLAIGMVREFVLGHPFSHGEFLSGGTWLMIWIVGAGATVGPILLVRSARLVTRAGPDRLSVRFAPFHRRPRVIDLGEVVGVESVACSPVREYGGYGVRLTRHGRAYNVSGKRGVRITFRSGQHLLIGSQRPDELAAAVEAARAAASG